MADADIKALSSATGAYAVLRPAVSRSGADAASGNQTPATGKSVPEAGNIAPPEKPDLEELARKLNVASQSIGRDLRFEVDLESGRSVIQVLDRETGEVIRQIPAEKTGRLLSSDGSELRLVNRRV